MSFLRKLLQWLGFHAEEQHHTPASQPSPIPTAEAIPTKDHATAIAQIKANGWWQGSVIAAADLPVTGASDGIDHWIVVSQTCNLYNPSFDLVPKFEVVGAALLDSCNPAMTKGNDPRVLHVLMLPANFGSLNGVEIMPPVDSGRRTSPARIALG